MTKEKNLHKIVVIYLVKNANGERIYFQKKNICNFWSTTADGKSMPLSCAAIRLSRMCSRLIGWQEEAAVGRGTVSHSRGQ